MSNGFKRAMAVLLTVFILFSLVPIGFTTGGEELFSESVVPGIGDGGALLAALSEEPEGNANGNAGITITFKITNPNYTNDPATNFTHLTSNTPYTGGELTYTSWAGTYKVTGTGVVTSFTIPAGTSLAQNGLSAPRFSPFNLSSPTPNQYSYMAAYSWLTGDGRVCSENTVFAVSTELELSLHQDGEDYGIDFICCDEHDSWNSISYDCATMSPTFKLGNKLSEEYFITKERILARYANKNNHQLDGFAGWALKDYATGAFVPLTSNTSLTAAHLDPQYGRSFKAYAMWDEPAVPATATFRNGETTVEVRALSVGDALGTLPTVTAPEGQMFLGWREMNANSAFVTAETVISADTTYEAVFGAAGYCSAVFHDILPDGTAAGTAVTRSVPAGTRFADIEDAALSDGAMLSECLWHTAPGTAPIDNSAYVVSSDAAFYTYTYQVVLNFTPDAPLAAMASAVEATPGENGVMTITITARESEPLTLSDFIIDGVDYSLYEWTYTDDQNNVQTLDIDDLIADGLSCNIVAASSGEPASADVTPVSNYPVNFYIFIDGAREKLAARSVTAYKIWDPTAYNSSTRSNSGNYRYYLLAETLADVYGDFGFRTSDLTVGTRYFPNATKNEANIWADAAVQVIDGRTFSALGLRVEEMDVYYLPKQSLTANSGTWTNYQTTDSFYSVTVQDPDGLFYAEGDLPAPTYTLNGRTAAASVLNTALDPAQNAIWTAAGANTHTAAAGTENQDGTVTFAIPAISEPYIITASLLQLDTQISYDINLPVIPDGTSPTIGGAAACTDTPAAGETTYTVLAPSLLSYAYTSSDHEPGTAAFLGWAVNGNTDAEDLVQPGAELNLYDYGDVITLTAQWSMELTSLGTVTFHDMLPGGGEAGTPIELVLPVGSSLTGIEDETLSDGTLISECVWYTAGGSGPISLADYEAADGAELYTYTHRLVLNYAPGEPDAQTITITAREGEPLSALDFVVNGVDYSLYSWTHEDDLGVTQTLDIPNLIANGLTDSIEAAGNGALAFSGLTPEPGHTINFYIFIDEQRVKLETRTGVTAYCNGSLTQSGNRRYLPAAILESVYGDFGFSAEQLVSGTRYFPHVDANGGNIWANTPVLEQNGYFFSPIISHPHTTGTDVYYLPKQSLTANSGAWANFQTTDSFYSVTVEDPDEFVYATADVPEVSYTFKGQMAAVTVSGIPPAEEDNVIWTCTGRTTGTAIDGTVNSDDTVTFIIENISEPYVIQAGLDNGVRRITYDINRPHPPVDEEYECPTIQGGDTYIETTAEGADTYTVRAPSLTSYFYATYNTNGVLQKHIGEATFLGWAVNGDTDAEDLVQPGDMLNLSDYSGTIHLDAQWNTECANTQNRVGSMVNYYVSLAAHPLGYSTEWTGDIDQAYFTDSVYTDDCGVDAGIIPDLELYETHYLTEKVNQYFVLGGTSGTDINESHAEIISELSAGYTLTSPVDHADYTFQLTFPSDEQVLHRIRQLMMQGGPRSHIIINGSEVTVDEMNTANFSVRWYVFKYDVTDGWHIDGVLVSKPGTIRVTKTFAGDADAIEAVKENYSISVAAAPGQNGVVHTGETLELGNAEHAEGSNVYAWNVPVDRYYRYVVSETNYIY